MAQGFFLNTTIIEEILMWKTNSSENIAVFDPIARASSSVGSLLSPDDEQKAAAVTQVLEAWCASEDFDSMLSEAGKKNVSIDISLGRESLALYSGSQSFVAGVPIDMVLTAFSALVRTDLRARESRCGARIDELFLWQASFVLFDLHEIALLILAACASRDVLSMYDRLLSIKEQPATLNQIDTESLADELSPQFASGMRMFALANFEAAEKAFLLAIEKSPSSPSAYLALGLVHLMCQRKDAASLVIDEAANKAGSPALLDSLRHLLSADDANCSLDLWADDPVSVAVASFLLLLRRDFARVQNISARHRENFPADVIMRVIELESLFIPISERMRNDPPLPGSPGADVAASLEQISSLLQEIEHAASSSNLLALHARALINHSAVCLMNRKFSQAQTLATDAIALNESSAAGKLNLATAFLAAGDLPRALRSLESMPAAQSNRARRLAAEAYYHTCSFDLALDIWKRDITIEKDRIWVLRILCRMLEVYRLLRDSANAQICVDELLTKFQHEPETLFALGYELWEMQRSDDALAALKRAKELAMPNLKKWISWEMGRVYFSVGQALSATDEYSLIAEKGVDSIQAREFAVALFKAGLLPAAYERSKALREAVADVIPGITEIETDYLVRLGKMEKAKDLLKKLSQKRPLSVLNRMAIVRICASLGQEEEARAELEKVQHLKLTPEMREEVEQFAADLDVVLTIKERSAGH